MEKLQSLNTHEKLKSRGTIRGKLKYSCVMTPIRTQSKSQSLGELQQLKSSISKLPNISTSCLTKERKKVIELDVLLGTREEWCQRRKFPVPEISSQDRRALRRFFNTLDDDGSGEVNFNELLDPLVSSGMYQSSQQVIRLLSTLDKNHSNGIDFDEFLFSITSQQFGDRQKLKTLGKYINMLFTITV
jgi:hypothetical protein